MATSDSRNYNLTAAEVIEYALKKINLVPDGGTVQAEMQTRAQRELNLLLKEWQKYPGIWRLQEAYLAPTANTKGFNLTPRPYRIVDVRFRGTGGTDISMFEMSRQDYYDLPNKGSTGTPTQWFFDPLRDTSSIYVWPVLSSVTTETIRVTYQRRFEDVDTTTENIDIAQEHLGTVGYNLAARLADDYGRKGEHINRIIARAQALFEEMRDADRPEFIEFVPDERY
jgi:hypothetical protein